MAEIVQGIKIADLPEAENIADANVVVMEDDEATKKITADKVKKYMSEDVADEIDKLNEKVDQLFVSNALDGTESKYKQAMRAWFLANDAEDADCAELTALCDRWYKITRPEWCGWMEFAQPDTGDDGPDGTKGGDNAWLVSIPSTDTEANQDDYAGLPLFACIDVNWIVDADTLQPMITAIDGITSSFDRYDPEKFVGVMQMSGYVGRQENDNTYLHIYSADNDNDFELEPLPESINPDGTIREWVVHSKYMSGWINGKMTACAGVIPRTYNSHNSWQTNSKAIGAQYSGSTMADMAFLEIMANLKYGLTLDGIIQGCCNMNQQYVCQVAETNVKRVILSTSNAANLEVGESCLVGNYTSSTDRGNAGMYSISGNLGTIITAIETVTIDGANYSAVYLDTEDAFDTGANGSAVSGTTYLSSFHWITGKTDEVLGNDGSPVSNTSGKYPGKIQGIEFMNGCYETLTNVILNMFYDDENCYYEPYIVRSTANQSTSLTDSYEAVGITCPDTVSSASWQYVKKKDYKKGVLFPSVIGGTSSTYHKNGFYQAVPAAQTREWLSCGCLFNGVASAGLSALAGSNALSDSTWSYGSRLSPNGNWGELTA